MNLLGIALMKERFVLFRLQAGQHAGLRLRLLRTFLVVVDPKIKLELLCRLPPTDEDACHTAFYFFP